MGMSRKGEDGWIEMNWGEMGGTTGFKHDLYIHFLLLLLSPFIFFDFNSPARGLSV